jgi:hypothetical protein
VKTAVNLRITRYEVLTAVTMKVSVFWDVTPCTLEKIFANFFDEPGASSYRVDEMQVVKYLHDYTAFNSRRTQSSTFEFNKT